MIGIAFIFIGTNPGREREVIDELMKFDDVVRNEIYILFGEWDIVIRVRGDEFGNFNVHKIRQIKGVADTKVMTTTG